MKARRSGDGHIVVVGAVRYREPIGRIRLPYPALIAEERAINRLSRDWSGSGLFPRTLAMGVPERHVEPAVSLDGAAEWAATTGQRDPPPGGVEDSTGSFALGLHAASVGDGDPLSPTSLVGVRVLAPGEYREVPVPIWTANPFPIERPDDPDQRRRADWTGIDVVPRSGEPRTVELVATLWRRLGADARRSRPVYTDAGRPVTDRATVTLEPGTAPTHGEVSNARGRTDRQRDRRGTDRQRTDRQRTDRQRRDRP